MDEALKAAAEKRGLDPKTSTWKDVNNYDDRLAFKDAAEKRGLDPETSTWKDVNDYDHRTRNNKRQ